jgi:maltose alpha-D-glucosyltransferase/alpha-amylase
MGSKDLSLLEPWGHFWFAWVGAAYLKAYFDKVGPATFLPATSEERRLLLNVYLLEKAVYELRDELSNRPDWVNIPLQGILRILNHGESA